MHICPGTKECQLFLVCPHAKPHKTWGSCGSRSACNCPACVTEDDLIYHVTLEWVKRAKGENNDGKRL